MEQRRARARDLGSLCLILAGFGGLVTVPAVAGGCKGDQLTGAKAEVGREKIKVTMPAVPNLEVPKPNPDGSHTVKELRVQGQRYFKQEITIKGYVVWAYDCVTAIRKPDEDDAAVKKRIEEDPTQCRRPAFYLGDTPDVPAERSVSVVEVPRPITKLEKERLPKEEVERWPAVPPYKVGDEVEVTGEWNTTSPHGETNTDGLLIYRSMKNVTEGWESPAPVEQMDPGIRPPAH